MSHDETQQPVVEYMPDENHATTYQAHIVAIVIKVIAIWLFANILSAIFPFMISAFRFGGSQSADDILPFLFMLVLLVVIPGGMWMLSGWLSFRIVGRSTQTDPPYPKHFLPSLIQPIAFSILGVWIAIVNIASLPAAIISESRGSQISYRDFSLANIVFSPSFVLFLLGVGLFFGANGLAKLFRRFQTPELHRNIVKPQNNPQSSESGPSDPNSPSR